jgi:hypothetical protein
LIAPRQLRDLLGERAISCIENYESISHLPDGPHVACHGKLTQNFHLHRLGHHELRTLISCSRCRLWNALLHPRQLEELAKLLQHVRDIDWLRQECFGARRDTGGLLILGYTSRHSDDWNHAQIRDLLDPLHRLQATHHRHSDIHQNQIRRRG